MGDDYGLAADTSRDCLCNRRFLYFRYGQHTNAVGAPKQIHLPAMARVLDCVWVVLADPRDARVYRPIRAIVRRTYDLWRGDLHGCARYASGNARSLCRARSWCWDCKHQYRGGAPPALVGCSRPPRRGLLSRASNIWLVPPQFYFVTQ